MLRFRFFIFILVLIVFDTSLFKAPLAAETSQKTFRFSLYIEPHSQDPVQLSALDSAYIFSNLYRGLYKYASDGSLVSIGAKECKQTKLRIVCELHPSFKWSDGSQVKAQDYVFSFRRFVDPSNKSKEATALLSLKNAKSIISGQSKIETLGIKALNDFKLEFTFDEFDTDFIHKLSSPLLVPLKEHKGKPQFDLFNGPYSIASHEKGKKIYLKTNPHYSFGHKQRPNIEVLFVEEAATMLSLYRTDRIDFVTQVPASEIKALKNDPEFFFTPLLRFDYIGFGHYLKNQPDIRKAFALAADFEAFKIIFDALGRPGCTGLVPEFFDTPPCLTYSPAEAKKAIQNANPEILKKLTLSFSKIATDDLRRVAEWYQAQWKSILNIQVELLQREIGMYRKELRTEAPPIFRVGIPLDRPTCLAALETFESNSPDNFIQLNDKNYDKVIEQLKKTSSEASKKVLCRKAVEILLKDYRIIPQGQIHFARLLKSKWKGLEINSMGHIDLANLHHVSK